MRLENKMKVGVAVPTLSDLNYLQAKCKKQITGFSIFKNVTGTSPFIKFLMKP